MIQSVISIIAIIVLAEMSRRANYRYRREAKLPMQWFLDGTVTKTAPRLFALFLPPVLFTCILAAMVALSMLSSPRPGQEGSVVPVIASVAFLFVGIYAFYLRLIDKSLGGWGS